MSGQGSSRRSIRQSLLVGVVGLALGLALWGCSALNSMVGVTPKDDLLPQGGDVVATGGSYRLNLTGESGETLIGYVWLYIERQGGGASVYDYSIPVAVTCTDSPGSEDPLDFTIGVEGTDNQVTLPSNWSSQANGTLSADLVKVKVELPASENTGPATFQRELHFAATGVNAQNGGSKQTTCSIHVEVTVSEGEGGDTTLPAAAITVPQAQCYNAISGNAKQWSGTISGTATDNVGVTKVEVYVGLAPTPVYAGDAVISGDPTNCTWSYAYVPPADGVYAVYAKAYDAATNVGPSSTVTFTYDTTPPVVTITVPANGVPYILNSVWSYDFSCTDNIGVTAQSATLDGTPVAAASGDPLDTSVTALGAHTFCVTAADCAGNETTVCSTYSVVGLGCSHGYWKNHLSNWPAPYTPGDKVTTMFSAPVLSWVWPKGAFSTLGNQTLLQALKYTATTTSKPIDAARLLVLQGIAAALNQAKYGSAYLYQGSIVDAVNAALQQGSDTNAQWRARMLALKTLLDTANNQLCRP